MDAADEHDYQRYRTKKLARGEEPRAREEWRRVRGKWAKSREFGNRFRDGMCVELGRTEDKGWHTEVYYQSGIGKRYFDSAVVRDGQAMEFKAGKVGSEALEQLKKDGRAIRDGWSIEWYIVEGAKIDKEVQEKIRELQSRYPERFRTIAVTREQMMRAVEIGRELAREREERALTKERQERARVAERDQRARDKELARSVSPRELDEKREQFRVQATEQTRKIAEQREKGQAIEIDKLRGSHTRLTKDLVDIREIERAKAREMVRDAGLGREHAQELERLTEWDHEYKRSDVTRDLVKIGSTLAREDKERIEREAIEKQREKVREMGERAVREGMPRDVWHVYEVSRPQPGEEARPAPTRADTEQERSIHQQRERERAEREREGRHRRE